MGGPSSGSGGGGPESESGPSEEISDYAVPDDVLAATLEGEAVLLDMDTRRYYRLNETGAWIWEGLRDGLDREELVAHVTDRFQVSPEEARRELEEFLAHLREHDLLDGSP